ncbi:MAG: hypothetical protein OEW45_12730 [Deltaproteobacteria bacterium]|nr:hypothetical protein [Deltaproteobacteria bacterium]
MLGYQVVKQVCLDRYLLNLLVWPVVSSLAEATITGIAYDVLKGRCPCGTAQGVIIKMEVRKTSE